MATGEVTLPLLSAFQRLGGLLDQPEDIPILAPVIHREILYRLLVGDQGARLRQIASAGSRSHHMHLRGHSIFSRSRKIYPMLNQQLEAVA